MSAVRFSILLSLFCLECATTAYRVQHVQHHTEDIDTVEYYIIRW